MLRSDLKIFKPERLGGEPNAGGQRTNKAIENGKLNDVFAAISDVDYAWSAFELAKLFPAVATADASLFADARVFISDEPDDPLVTVLLAESEQLTDTSVLSDMMGMLGTGRFHGMATTTGAMEAGTQEVPVNRISANLAPTTSRRNAHTNVKPAQDASGYKLAQQKSYGFLYNISIDVPDMLMERPVFYGSYKYYDASQGRWVTKVISQVFFSLNGTTVTTTLTEAVRPGYDFNLYYLPTGDFRYHSFYRDGATIQLAEGERVQPKTVKVKLQSEAALATDDGAGNFIVDARLVAQIDYETGVITELEPLDFTQAHSIYGAIIRTQPLSVRETQFSVEHDVIPDSLYIRCTSSTGTPMSASGDTNGQITGNGVSGTLNAANLVSLVFDVDVQPESISYDYDELIHDPVPTPPGGIDRSQLPGGGIVPIFHVDNLINIQSRQRTQHPVLSNGDVITIEAGADWVDIIDGSGNSLYSGSDSNYSHDKASGKITINAGIVGFTGPYIITVIHSELAMIADIDVTTLRTFIPTKRAYPAGATVSSVYWLGNLQGASSDERTLSAWQNNFEEVGTPAANSINFTQYPIEFNNQGCISQRWACVFDGNGAFDVIGQHIGHIGTFDVIADCTPLNPFTGAPYFIIRKEALGEGLGAGEAFLFTSKASSKPIMVTRSVSPGHSDIETDNSTIAFLGVYQ
ncbi:hypothetical protein [Pseudoalteromonas sp. R3]|uniref:hypothetical protein n=1 Tax=Pseudoalteromonas sp. R3 TaxID=1709477 RepID=UPI0006B4B0C4|nr:hypothetical protein [Pseudoalteromonas sp. R3]AZZ98749.1 hypothetical protein ELR70_17585 [Pseudoalteromonas sp. R3]